MTKLRDELITLAHGSGGKATHMLVEQLFLEELRNPLLEELGDAAVADGLAFTTDSFVVKPLFFPGGDIGELAVNGTVNDLAVAGAEPLWLSAGFVIEEGFPLGDLRRIARSMARAAERAGVAVVAGDTKVVERGSADGLFVTTAGVGRMRATFGEPQSGDRDTRLGDARRPRLRSPGRARRPAPGVESRERHRAGPRARRGALRSSARPSASCATRRAAVSRRR